MSTNLPSILNPDENLHTWRLSKDIPSPEKNSSNRRRNPPTPLILTISNVAPQNCSIKLIERRSKRIRDNTRNRRNGIGSPKKSLRSPHIGNDLDNNRGRSRSPRLINAVFSPSPISTDTLKTPDECIIIYEPKHYQLKKCPTPTKPIGIVTELPSVFLARSPPDETDSITIEQIRQQSRQNSLSISKARGLPIIRMDTGFQNEYHSPDSCYSGSASGHDFNKSAALLSSSDSLSSSGTIFSAFIPIDLPTLPEPCAGPSSQRIQIRHKSSALTSKWRKI